MKIAEIRSHNDSITYYSTEGCFGNGLFRLPFIDRELVPCGAS